MELVLQETRRKRPLVDIPFGPASLLGKLGDVQAAAKAVIGLIPAPQITSDQVEVFRSDNVVSGAFPGLAELGVRPTALEPILPTYLYRYRKGGQFADLVAEAGKA
jgi:NADH dehydrogenase